MKFLTGPALRHGFIDTAELENQERKTELRGSDLMQEIMDVEGVKIVRHLSMQSGQDEEEWILQLDSEKTPVLIISKGQDSDIRLTRKQPGC